VFVAVHSENPHIATITPRLFLVLVTIFEDSPVRSFSPSLFLPTITAFTVALRPFIHAFQEYPAKSY